MTTCRKIDKEEQNENNFDPHGQKIKNRPKNSRPSHNSRAKCII